MPLMPTLALALAASSVAPVEFPGAQPQLAADGRRVGVVFGEGDSISFAGSRDGGRTFSAPVTLRSQGDLALGRHRGPRIAISGDALIVTAILAPGRADGDLFAWRSTDDGRTWSAPLRLNGVPASAREGLHGMAAAGKRVAVAWLDLRAPGTRIRAAVSDDAGATWPEDRLVYESPSGTVCQCCHPSVAISPKGDVVVMFRNAIGGARDMYLATSRDGGRSFAESAKLGHGTWRLDACPMDGGGLAIGTAGQVVSVWRREGDVFFAAPGQPERRLGTGRDPAIAIGRDGTWSVVYQGDEGVLMTDGKGEPRSLAVTGKAPLLLGLDDGTWLAAWEREKQVVVAPVAVR